MKSMKKLIPALAMLLVSLIVMSSASFAWFSMNKTVTATGMKVTATSASTFLQIINASGTFVDSDAQIQADAVNASKAIRPTSAVQAFTTTTLTALAGTEVFGDIKFVEAFSNDPGVSTRYSNYNDVTTSAKATDASNYYTLINDFKVRLNPTTGVNTATNLTVSNVTIKSDKTPAQDVMLNAVRVLVVSGDAWTIWSNSGEVKSSNSSIIAATVTDDKSPNTATDVKVYVYFDGEDAVTTTNNATTLGTDGYDVEIELSID